jgi:excisionase family DNA binding protein
MKEATIAPELLTTPEAARLLNIGTRTLWRWSHSGRAPKPVTLSGRCVRFKRAELLAWVAAGCPRIDGRAER